MRYIKSPKVYLCCGQYIATTDKTKSKSIVCPRCGMKPLRVRTPYIVIADI